MNIHTQPMYSLFDGAKVIPISIRLSTLYNKIIAMFKRVACRRVEVELRLPREIIPIGLKNGKY